MLQSEVAARVYRHKTSFFIITSDRVFQNKKANGIGIRAQASG